MRYALISLGRLGPSALRLYPAVECILRFSWSPALFRQYCTKHIRSATQIHHMKRHIANQRCRSPSCMDSTWNTTKPSLMTAFETGMFGHSALSFRDVDVGRWLHGACVYYNIDAGQMGSYYELGASKILMNIHIRKYRYREFIVAAIGKFES